MKAIHIASLGSIPAALLITACGDDVTKVTKIEGTSGMEVVTSADSLGKCTAEISGEMKFATKENAVYLCADSVWKNVSEAEKTACSAEILADSSGFKIVCDGDSIGVVRNGTDGKDGEKGEAGKDGASGESCKLVEGPVFEAGSSQIQTSFVVCGGDTVMLSDGRPGEGCDISDNGDGTVSVVCGETSSTLYKAFCGGKVYNPDSSFCVDDVVIENSELLNKKLVWDLMNSEIEYDMFIDKRDSQVYRSVKIGEQTWMAENLNYETDSSYCYKDNPENCQKYGRLYATRDIAKSACPAGWHLPDTSEIFSLIAAADGRDLARGEDNMAGKVLKSKSGWTDGNGTDALGFSALPAGYYNSYYSDFEKIENAANFWSSVGAIGVDYYLYIKRKSDDGSLYIYYHSSTVVGNSYSVRCVRD